MNMGTSATAGAKLQWGDAPGKPARVKQGEPKTRCATGVCAQGGCRLLLRGGAR